MPHSIAGHRRSAPQVYIKGVTPRPNRLLADESGKGRSWQWVVLIKYGRQPTVLPVPAPSDPYSYTTWLSKGKNPEHRELTGTTYRRMVKDVLLGKGHLKDGSMRRPRHPTNLLHDRDAAHTSKAFNKFAKDYNINAVVLPARSPDLDPLDYGVFGPAQKKLSAQMERRAMSWEEQCSFLEQAIKETNTDAAIMQLPRRIKRCIAAKGGHFE